MRSSTWTALVLLTGAQAHPAATICKEYDHTTTLTFTEYATQHVVDALGAQLVTTSFLKSKATVVPTSDCDSSIARDLRRWQWPKKNPTPLPTTTTLLPMTTTPLQIDAVSAGPSVYTRPTTTATSKTTTTSPTTTKNTSTSTTTTTTTTTTKPTSTTTTTTMTTSTLSSSSSTAVVTNKAYVDTVLRHHNQHRANHTVSTVTWNAALGETAKKIAATCRYEHNTTIDCPNGGCYGQNIGAGYLPTQMGLLISDGFYDSEVNSYTYYGSEPDLNKFSAYGHFTQIVWKNTNSVACYTMDCTNNPGGLYLPGGAIPGLRPFFTVCNYASPGNYVGQFAANVLKPVGLPSIYSNYGCPSSDNCEG